MIHRCIEQEAAPNISSNRVVLKNMNFHAKNLIYHHDNDSVQCRIQFCAENWYHKLNSNHATKNSHQKPPKPPIGGICQKCINETCRGSNSVWKIGIISLIWSTESNLIRFQSFGPFSAILRFFLFCGNANLSTFRSEYKALLGVKIFVWSMRNFWHQAVLCTRSGRCPKSHFPTSSQRFLLIKIVKNDGLVIRPNLSILRQWRFLSK